MIIYINHTRLEVFSGARLCDAVARYSKASYKLLMREQIWLEDKRGNSMDADGRLWDGIELYIKHKPK